MFTPHAFAKFTPATEPSATRARSLIVAFLLIAGLLGCETGVGPTLSDPPRNGVEAGKTTILCPDGITNATFYQGLSLNHSEGTNACFSPDGKLIIDGTDATPWFVAFDVSRLESTHMLFNPVHVSSKGAFQMALRGTVEGASKTLVSTSLLPQPNGLILIEIGFEHTHRRVADSVTVSFEWQGERQYRTRLPVQARLPIAFYNPSGGSPSKSATPNDEPTSGYWAYIDGTWVWMVDWTEGEGGNKRLLPATLIPAFPAPLDEIPVDLLRIDFTLDTEDVSPEAMVFTGINMPGITFTGVEY